jgi:hypothetical protein
VLAEQIATVKEQTAKSLKLTSDGQQRFGAEFTSSVANVIAEVGPLMVPVAPGSQFGKLTPIGEVFMEADDPAALLDHLGKNPDLASELYGLTPTQIARRIARIETELAKPKEPKQSAAPKALTPVKSQVRDDGGLSDGLTTEEWIRRRNRQIRG